ncbi:MAG TPA: SDR family oxidoreductase [Geminicoccaceae bacterium]
MRLQGKVALVTGGGCGFGEGIATRFAAEGAKVVVNDLREDEAERVSSAIGRASHEAIAVAGDVGQEADWRRLVEATRAAYGRLDILVNNAGTTYSNRPMLEVDEAEYDRVFRVNVKSIYWSAHAVVPLMREQGGGSFINIASTAGLRPRPGLTWYNASKGAVITMSKSMAVELAPDNIRVNAICPVVGETGLTAAFMGGDTPELRAKFTSTIPLGRMSRPADIAAACLYLAEDEASFITGVALEVDGGRCV